MAMFPQSVAEGNEYLKKLAVPIGDIRQARFGSVPITGTPTILLVNANGTVEKAWFGKLISSDESEVISEIANLAIRR